MPGPCPLKPVLTCSPLSVFADKTVGGNYLDFKIKREEAARYGLTVGDVQDVIQSAIGGMNVTYTVEGLERYPVNVRYMRELRDNLPMLKRVLISTPTGAKIPLEYVADIEIKKGPPVIKSENARKTAWLYVDIRDIDVGTYVKLAKQAVEEKVDFPEGYSIVWSGQYEYMERAQKRLQIVVPITLVIIFLLLYFNFKNITESLLKGKMRNLSDLYEAIIEGAVERVRPKMMTVTAIMAGLLPILWGSGTGSQVMKRIAAPMVGGMVTSTILTLIVIPAIYYLWKSREVKRLQAQFAAGDSQAPSEAGNDDEGEKA